LLPDLRSPSLAEQPPKKEMRICIVGSGAREVAIARSLKASPKCSAVLCFASTRNPALVELASEYEVGNIDSPEAVVAFCQANKAVMAVVGPEAPLNAGVVDALEAVGIKGIGPTKQMAQVECSKQFARNVMVKYGVPGCPIYRPFSSPAGMAEFFQELGGKYVVKADGLMGGKGVKVSGEHLANVDEALQFAQEIFEKGQAVVIEEKFVGEEFSLMSFCDGTTLVHMPPVQDHKRAYVGDTGPNTGGMGSYSCEDHLLPFMTQEHVAAACAINEAMARALKAESGGDGFKGILYGAFMCLNRGVGCIKFNARFGVPEALNVLALLESDLAAIFEAISAGTLSPALVSFARQATVVKYACPFGYPDAPLKNQAINISSLQNPAGLFLAAVDEANGQLLATGSRTAAVVARANTVAEAEARVEAEVRRISGSVFHRPDIGTTEVLMKRVVHQRQVRRIRIGVVGSTRGSSLQPILYAIRDGRINASIEVVVSNVASAYILQRARVNNLKTVHIVGKGRVREEFDRDVTAALVAAEVDIVLLIGFMRIVSGEFCRAWHGRCINVHPSLLPKHANLMDLAVHQSVLDAGDSESGCTVHQVIDEVDGGSTVMQLTTPVVPGETAETLKAKVQALEGEGMIQAIQMFDRDGCLPGGESSDAKRQRLLSPVKN